MEILIVLAILGLLAASAVVALGTLRGGSDLQAEARGFSRVLELARSRTIASEEDTRYGVYVDTGTTPHQYVLFQGVAPLYDYGSRVVSEDEVHKLRETIEFSSVSFGGGPEVVFDRIQGTTSQTGNAQLRIKAAPGNIITVYVESSGAVEIDTSVAPTDDDRQKDSRHAHIDYTGRIIDTAIETIILDFGTATETIVMQDNLSGGQIVWEGDVDVGGEIQKVKIHTHQLNNGFDTQFSVHRDRRFNTKPLTIEIGVIPGPDPDPDIGTLIQYDAAGVISLGTSSYVFGTQEQ